MYFSVKKKEWQFLLKFNEESALKNQASRITHRGKCASASDQSGLVKLGCVTGQDWVAADEKWVDCEFTLTARTGAEVAAHKQAGGVRASPRQSRAPFIAAYMCNMRAVLRKSVRASSC